MTADIEARDMAKLSMVHAHIKEEVAGTFAVYNSDAAFAHVCIFYCNVTQQ